jgi:O-antigen biosynthesis protein
LRDYFRPNERELVHNMAESEELKDAGNGNSLAIAKQALREKAERDLCNFLESSSSLDFTLATHPRITVLIILWNQAELTLTCLKALCKEDNEAMEVLVLDNASTDKTSELLSRISGIRVIKNEENVGFLRAVNQGASMANGRYLLLLNNDAVIRPGSLSRAIELIDNSPDIGAVGGRIILPDGLLQEAGSIVWNDGSCLGYARGQLPETNEVMFRRDVDYCSGVFLLTRRDLFMEMGGFDEAYAPAYFEETDYCFRLWERGMRVVYDPDVAVDHFEFGSSGTSDKAKAQMKINLQIFSGKHSIALKNRFSCSSANILRARMRDNFKGRVLFLDDRVPLRNLGAGYPRSRLILNEMHNNGWFVTFFPLCHIDDDWQETYRVIPTGIEVMRGIGFQHLESFLTERKGYYDVIMVSRPTNIPLVNAIYKRRPRIFAGTHIIYDAEAVRAVREIAKMRLAKDPPDEQQIEEMISEEMQLACIADRIVTVSADEASFFSRNGYKDIFVLGHAVEATPTPAIFNERNGMLFVGQLTNDNTPNVDSIIWFVNQILPHIRSRIGPEFKLYVVGRNGAPSINAINDENVSIIGPVDDLIPWYNKCRIFIAPTRYAAGIPHKIHEAAGYGVPVVSTPILARQLGWENEDQLLIGSDPDSFAEQCVRLYTDETLWLHIRDNALTKIRNEHSHEVFRRTLNSILTFDGKRSRIPLKGFYRWAKLALSS